jgi:glucose-1-phosphate adenylyltransferase
LVVSEWQADEYLILSGDHLYRMDYGDFVRRHRETGADVTISVVPMDHRRASDFGLMKIDNAGRIIDFSEKPKGDALSAMAVDTSVLGLTADEAKEKPYIASMGIYVFKREALVRLLRDFPEQIDFGKEIIPNSAKDYNLQAYLFNDYWEDIGTIESFYDANLALTQQPRPPFSFYDEDAPDLYPSALSATKQVAGLPRTGVDHQRRLYFEELLDHPFGLRGTLAR